MLQMRHLPYKTHPCFLGISVLLFILFDIQICRLQLKSSHIITFIEILYTLLINNLVIYEALFLELLTFARTLFCSDQCADK
jgi:hypothetical protein